MKLIAKALAVVGAATLIGPVLGFVAGVAATAIYNATNPEVADALEKIKKELNHESDEKDEYDEGEAMPGTHSGVNNADVEYAKNMADDIQREMDKK